MPLNDITIICLATGDFFQPDDETKYYIDGYDTINGNNTLGLGGEYLKMTQEIHPEAPHCLCDMILRQRNGGFVDADPADPTYMRRRFIELWRFLTTTPSGFRQDRINHSDEQMPNGCLCGKRL